MRERIQPDERPDNVLSGLRVVEIGQFIAVPAAGQALRDLGAEVIKIEPAAGDPARRIAWPHDDFGPMFIPYNRGKRSVVLNLSSQQGCATAVELALSADVVLHNARPGAMHKAGLSAESLRVHKPALIVAAVSGYGSDSAFALRPGFDIAAQAESGMMSINGDATSPPTRVGFTAVDVMASHAVTQAVLAALLRRGQRGQGASIEVSLIDVALQAMAYPWADYQMNGRLPERRGSGQASTAPAADLIATADGAVVLSAYMDEHFVRLARVIGQPAMATDARFSTNAARVANRAALLDALKSAFASTDTATLCERLNHAGVVVAAVRNFDQVRCGPHGLSEDLFVNVGTPTRNSVALPIRAFHLDGCSEGALPLPAIGEHTQEVLDDLALRKSRAA